MAGYRERTIDGVLRRLLSDLPALLIVGPRAAGKTTTASRLARTVVRLDRSVEAAAFRADPDVALRGLPEPLLIDEWQVVPEVLGAVKRAVDEDARAGRFLLTGSTRAGVQAATWPGTGRVVRVPLYGMTLNEQARRPDLDPWIDRLASGRELEPAADPPDLRGYVEIALRSGFPEAALVLEGEARERWLDGYVDQIVTRDVRDLVEVRDPARLRRFLSAYALNSAGVVDDKTLYDAAGINRRTALSYERLLTDLFVIDGIPAWTSNRLRRLTMSPKRYVVDPGILGRILGADARTVMRDGNLLGRLLETFVVSHIRAELFAASSAPHLHHLRDREGRHEIDIVAELAGRRIVAIEVKADAAPGRAAARHLEWFRDRIGQAFVAGVVLHTGPRAFRLGDRIHAVPISSLWT